MRSQDSQEYKFLLDHDDRGGGVRGAHARRSRTPHARGDVLHGAHVRRSRILRDCDGARDAHVHRSRIPRDYGGARDVRVHRSRILHVHDGVYVRS